jgi:UDP-2,3-diacylglucosamine hydrolase
MKKTLFISDLHLHESRPLVTRAFFRFLDTTAKEVTALYILGDFFDAWIGDDDDQPLVAEVANALSKLARNKTQIYLMHGNRDFLLGEDFVKRANAKIIPEETCIDLYGTKTLLLHGDSLCTADKDYIQFRTMVRNPVWQEHFLTQSLEVRRAIASELRNKSKNMNSLKADDILDVSPTEVETVFIRHQVQQLIHGHTHRPARHQLMINNQKSERIVLGDWHDSFWYVCADKNGIQLIKEEIK